MMAVPRKRRLLDDPQSMVNADRRIGEDGKDSVYDDGDEDASDATPMLPLTPSKTLSATPGHIVSPTFDMPVHDSLAKDAEREGIARTRKCGRLPRGERMAAVHLNVPAGVWTRFKRVAARSPCPYLPHMASRANSMRGE
jgi:hypothetical protein